MTTTVQHPYSLKIIRPILSLCDSSGQMQVLHSDPLIQSLAMASTAWAIALTIREASHVCGTVDQDLCGGPYCDGSQRNRNSDSSWARQRVPKKGLGL